MDPEKTIQLYFDKFLFPVTYATLQTFITDELHRLAKETGCSIDGLEIKFRENGDEETVAYFAHAEDEPIGFCFHLNKFNKTSPNRIIDTVRHEFAHFMVCVQYKGHQPLEAHGKEWKKACDILGALPSPYMIGGKTKHLV